MGWPKTNERYRLYKERRSGTYLLVGMDDDATNPDGSRLYVGELFSTPRKTPTLTTGTVSAEYLRMTCSRVGWTDLPRAWQEAFLTFWFELEPKEDPKDCRGLWPMGTTAEEKEHALLGTTANLHQQG